MAIRPSRFYNDAALGAGFDALAAAFAPPSGADAAGWASANAKNAEAARLAQFFADAPTLDAGAYDRLGPALGLWTPNQGVGITMRGQDIESSDRRYGYDQGLAGTRYTADRTYAASTENNAADNVRALQTNAADNARALDQTRLSSLAGLYGPVAEGAIRPEVPANIAALYGAPSALPAVAGQARPMSETEQKASERQRLAEGGLLTDQMLVDTIMGAETPVEAIDPTTGRPTFASPGRAVREGLAPYNKPAAGDATEISRLIAERDALAPDDPNRAAFNARIQALGRGQQQSAYDKTNDDSLAALNATIYDGAVGAIGDRAMLETLREAVEAPGTPQGALGPTRLGLAKLANAFGIEAGDTANGEIVNALGNQLALRLRDPSNGAGMPGSLSDSDRAFLTSMSVSLGNSPEANRRLVAHYLRLQEKNIALENLRRSYVQQNGRLDEGFRAVVGDFLQKTGIYAVADGTGEDTTALPPTPGAPDAPATQAAPSVERWERGPDGAMRRAQ